MLPPSGKIPNSLEQLYRKRISIVGSLRHCPCHDWGMAGGSLCVVGS